MPDIAITMIPGRDRETKREPVRTRYNTKKAMNGGELMLLRQMKYFTSIVRNNSFTEAAEECYISQSAISQQIQALEADLGVTLLVRENRKFHLTPAGEYFYRQAVILLGETERPWPACLPWRNSEADTAIGATIIRKRLYIHCNRKNNIRVYHFTGQAPPK